MEEVAVALSCQLLLIVLSEVMLLPRMKSLPLLVRRKTTRTTELQESIGKGDGNYFISEKITVAQRAIYSYELLLEMHRTPAYEMVLPSVRGVGYKLLLITVNLFLRKKGQYDIEMIEKRNYYDKK
ncbi:hypothetical protein STEG23_009460, partial [Scotinomys teguina]